MPSHPFTADQFPGQPRELPPLMTLWRRREAYREAAELDPPVHLLAEVYADVGQRLAAAMKEEPK